MLSWLLQGGPKDEKHRGKWHPIVSFVLHYAFVLSVMVSCHDRLLRLYGISLTEPRNDRCLFTTNMERHRRVGAFLLCYFAVYFTTRLAIQWKGNFYIEFYKQTFLCSVTIFMAGVGLISGRPILAQAFCVAVGFDQLLWYVDLACYAIFNTFPIGVSKYLFQPGTSWLSRSTSTHHLWTIPLVLWTCKSLHIASLPLANLAIWANVLPSRLLTPFTIDVDGKQQIYLNMNLAYEMWSDVKMKILFIFKDDLPYFVRMFFWGIFFNSAVYCFLHLITLGNLRTKHIC